MDRADLEQWKPKDVARLLALVEHERRYFQDMVAALPVGLVVVSADLDVVSANRCFRQLVGLRSDEILRRRLEDVLPVQGLKDGVSAALGVGGKPQTFHATMVDGEQTRQMRIAVQPLRGWEMDDGFDEALIVIEDLSAVERADAPEIRTAASTASRDLLQELGAITWESDPETLAFTFVNRRAEEILGYRPEDWLASPDFWARRTDAADRERVEQCYRSVARDGATSVCEYRAIAGDGHRVWLRETVRLRRDADGKPRSLIGLAFDVTARKQAEDQTASPQKIEALGRLASKVAHDFNNLLMIIAGYGEELRNSLPSSSPLHTDMEEILKATDRVYSLTNQLQSYGRRPPLLLATVDINELVAGLEESLRRLLGSQVELTVTPDATRREVHTDQAQIGQAIVAFALHASHEMKGSGRLSIATSDVEIRESYADAGLPPGNYVMVSLIDTSAGLDADAKARLFEPWLLTDETAREVRLALVAACGVIRQSGGDVAILSEPGLGTTCRIYLPAATPVPVTPAPEPIPPPATVVEPEAPTMETILVVEDESGIRALVRKILRRQGYTVIEAPHGEEALRLCAEHTGPIDLLVTDVMMPHMSGRELSERLLVLRPGIKVLFVSGYTDDTAIQSGTFPPGAAFLQKPFTLGSLLGKVREVLDAPHA